MSDDWIMRNIWQATPDEIAQEVQAKTQALLMQEAMTQSQADADTTG
jgi:hypothetical protein